MNSRNPRHLQRIPQWSPLWTLAFLITLLLPNQAAAQSGYTAVNIGQLSTGGSGYASAINKSGQITGWSLTSSLAYHAFLYSGGTMTDIGTLSGASGSYASGIANNGDIAGDSPALSTGFLYSGGSMTNLGTGGGFMQVSGVSNAGVVGYFNNGTINHAFVYNSGTMTDIGTLAGPTGASFGFAINDSGQAVGVSSLTCVCAGHAFLYASGTMTDLGTVTGYTNSQANAINNIGQVAGVIYNGSTTTGHAFLYSSGTMTDLGTLPGYSYTYATAINNNGVVVGVATNSGGSPSTVFIYANGVMTDVNTLIPGHANFSSLSGINDSGQISATDAGGTMYLLVPTVGKALGNCKCGSGKPGQVGVGDPITISSGNVYEQTTDYTTVGQNPLAFIRYYNSQGATVPTFAITVGTGWRSNFDRYLRILSSSSVVAERADGQQVQFTLSGSTWTTDSDLDISLTNTGSTWTLTDQDDTVETYTTMTGGHEALLNSIALRNGYTQTLTYNTSQQLTSVSDSYSRSLTLTYDFNGLLQTVTTPDSTTLTYAHNNISGIAQLVSVTYPTSPSTNQTYLYGNSSFLYALTGITDENGNSYATWTYDTEGRGLTAKLGTGANLTTLTYNSNGTTTVTNALGVADTYTFTTLQGTPKVTGISRASTSNTAAATETLTYDSNGFLASVTDWNGNQTTYVNNSHGLPTTINEAVGSSVARTTTIAYNATFVHLPDSITTPGVTTSFTYQTGTGNVLTKTLTDTTTGSTPYSTNGQTRTWTNTWTSSNMLLGTVKTPNNNTTTYAYNSSGALTSITDALTHATNITSVTGGGRPLTVVDPNSVTTTLTYSPRQWLLTSSVSATGGPFTTTYAYDAAGNLTKKTLPDASYLAYTYDTAHRVTKVTDTLGDYISYTLDALGDRTQANTYDPSSTLTRQHSATFDNLGRMLTDVGGVGQTTTYTYDKNGNALTVADGLSNTTTRIFDALNRLQKSTDALSGVTLFAYDAHDRPLTVTDPNGNATTYVYSGFGDAKQQVSPDTGTTVYHYDSDANLTQKTDASSNVTNQTFDALDRVLTTTYPADSTLNVAYTYDQTGTGFTFGIGRLTSLTDAAGSLTRAYDARGDLLTEKRTNGSTVLTTGYTYDAAMRPASISYPSGTLRTNTRNSIGNITNVAVTPPGGSTATNLASSITYAPFGPVKSYSYFNGSGATYSFDQDYRITAINDEWLSLYTWDNANNISSEGSYGSSGDDITYTYDALNRMTNAYALWGYGNIAYTYDANGNITSNHGYTFTYTPGTNQISQSNWLDPYWGPQTETASYTATGNATSLYITTCPCPSFTGTYNAANRLATEFTRGGVSTTLTYDYQGERLVKAFGGSPSTYFSYDQNSTLLEEVNNGFYADYIYLGGRLIGIQENSSSGGGPITTALYTDTTDITGDVRGVWDASNTNVWGAYPDPYGFHLGTGGSLPTQNLRFPGQYSDSEFPGFFYNINRDYASLKGRYLQADPIGLAGGLNPYAYANDNPWKFIDPSGLDSHHVFPQSLWRNTNIPPDAQRVFNNSTVQTPGRHGWSKAHSNYNQRANALFNHWCEAKQVDPTAMTASQAADFIDYLRTDPEISSFNFAMASGEDPGIESAGAFNALGIGEMILDFIITANDAEKRGVDPYWLYGYRHGWLQPSQTVY